MNINLPASIIEILNNSEYRENYFISEYEQDEIISLYEKYGFQLNNSLVELISVFGNRVIYYCNNSIPNRTNEYELNFSIDKVLGKFKKRNLLLMDIQYYCAMLNIESLIPIAVRPSGPLTYYITTKESIYAIIDTIILVYEGSNLWNSIERVFQGKYTKLELTKVENR